MPSYLDARSKSLADRLGEESGIVSAAELMWYLALYNGIRSQGSVSLCEFYHPMFLRFTKAAWEDLGFPIQPATFELDLLALLEFAYERRQHIEYLRNNLDQRPPAEELAAEWTPTIELLEELVAQTKEGDVVDIPAGKHGVEGWVAPLIAECKYRIVNCPACSTAYEAAAVVEEDFGWDDEALFGGHRYLCPAGHILFAFVRFDKRHLGSFG